VIGSKLGQDSYNIEVFRGYPQFLRAYTSIVPRSRHDRILSNPFQCIHINAPPPPKFDAAVYKQRCKEQPNLTTLYFPHIRPMRHKTSVSVHCELVASLNLHLHAAIYLAAQSHAKQIRNTFQLLQIVVFCVMTVVDRYQHFKRTYYLDLQDIRHFHPEYGSSSFIRNVSTHLPSQNHLLPLQETRLSYPVDEGSSFIRNVGIYPLNYTASHLWTLVLMFTAVGTSVFTNY
jgi:hypothetical protein